MRQILFVIILLTLVILSCEGRKTQSQALSEDIEEFKKEITVEVDVYYPETYMEREVDTILHNGYRVKIKTYSDMSNTVLFTEIKDTVNYQTYYRNFKFEVSVEKHNRLIYSETFDKAKVNTLLGYTTHQNTKPSTVNFDTSAILKFIQLNDTNSDDSILINLAYAIPEKDFIDWHILKIDADGTRSFTKTQIN